MSIQKKPGDFNEYTGTVLKLIAKSTTKLIIDYRVTELFGTKGSQCSNDVKTVLEHIEAEENSELNLIQNFAFTECTALKVLDLTNCKELIQIGECAFQTCSSLKTLTFPKGKLDSLVSSSFVGCSSLETVVIPNTVSEIGSACFRGCSNIASFTFEPTSNVTRFHKWFLYGKLTTFCIPRHVRSIDPGAFEGCVCMEEFTIEENSKHFKIVEGCILSFSGATIISYPCNKQGSFSIPDKVTDIQSVAFSGCKLSHITFPDSLQYIGSYAFSACRNIQEIILPESCTEIGEYAFYKCSGATKIKLPSNITKLPKYMFSECRFSEITIPEGVESIGDNCFNPNTNLKTIILPSTVTTIGGSVFPVNKPPINIVFKDGTNLKFDQESSMITDLDDTFISQYMGAHENYKPVLKASFTTIKSGAFLNKKNLISVSFESNSQLTRIEDNAFIRCSNLETFTFPENLLFIGEEAFAYCYNLKTITFNGSKDLVIGVRCFLNCSKVESVDARSSKLKDINEESFMFCTKMGSIQLPTTITSFLKNSFYGCSMLETIDIPTEAHIESVRESAFSKTKIKSFTFNEGSTITVIGTYSFAYCSELSSVTFCSSISTIDSFAFAFTNLTEVTLTATIKNLNDRCFINCKSITHFTIPSDCPMTVEGFGTGVFGNCVSLSTITCESDKFKVDTGALFSSDMTKILLFPPASDIHSFPIPSSVDLIGNGAFLGCTKLFSVMIPKNSVTQIGMRAFEDCVNLHYINFPVGISAVGQDAFKNCKSLYCGVDLEVRDEPFYTDLIKQAQFPEKALTNCASIKVNTCNPYKNNNRLGFLCFALLAIYK